MLAAISRTRKVVLALFIAPWILALREAGSGLVEEIPVAAPWTERTLLRNQPRIHRLFRWGDRVIVHADAVYTLDVAGARLDRVSCPGGAPMVDLAPIDANQAAILCRDAGGLYLLRGGLQGAARMELPETVRQSARMLRAFGSAVAVGVWRGDMIYIEHSGQKMFKTLQLPVPLSSSSEASDPVVARDSMLFVGYDRGE